jgi:hypothetical protein
MDPNESPQSDLIWEGRPTWRSHLGFTAFACLLVPVGVGLFLLLYQWMKLASTRYRLTTKRIEWEAGLFSKRIDGIDVWRVRHVEYFQSVGDRLGSVSRLHLFVQDRQEPEIVLRGLPAAREIYDRVAAAAQVGQKGTVGLVE